MNAFDSSDVRHGATAKPRRRPRVQPQPKGRRLASRTIEFASGVPTMDVAHQSFDHLVVEESGTVRSCVRPTLAMLETSDFAPVVERFAAMLQYAPDGIRRRLRLPDLRETGRQ